MSSSCVAAAGRPRSPPAGSRSTGCPAAPPWLPVEIHRELVRVRPNLYPVGLLAPELDVGGNQVVGEDSTAGEERVVGLERVERFVERRWDGGDVRELLRRKLIEVEVDRLAGV